MALLTSAFTLRRTSPVSTRGQLSPSAIVSPLQLLSIQGAGSHSAGLLKLLPVDEFILAFMPTSGPYVFSVSHPYILSIREWSESLSFSKNSTSPIAPVMSRLSFSTTFGVPMTECLAARSGKTCMSIISAVTRGDSIAALDAWRATAGQYGQVAGTKNLMFSLL